MERRAAPQPERAAKQRCCERRVAGGESLASLGECPFESPRVELTGLDPQDVSGCAGLEKDALERCPDLRHVDIDQLEGRLRRVSAPKRLDQLVGRDDLVRLHEETQEQDARLACREPDRTLAILELQRAEYPVLHPSPGS